MTIQEIFPADYPKNYPMKSSGALTHKVIQKGNIKKDGTAPLYIQVFVEGERKQFPLKIYVKPNQFDKNTQRVKGRSQMAIDANTLIDQQLARLNDIVVNYRLSEQHLSMPRLVEELTKPSLRLCYNTFASYMLTLEKGKIKDTTYRQQVAQLKKIKKWRKTITFREVTQELLEDLQHYCIKKCNNKPASVASTIKTFKKYLHKANEKGIRTPLHYSKIKITSMRGNRTFLLPEEIKQLVKFYNNPFISDVHHHTLRIFLFSCYTGLRISDLRTINDENIVGDRLVYTISKTGKFANMKLNETASSYAGYWPVKYTNEELNRSLKKIAKLCKINKNLYLHAARHSFATNFLLAGGRVENLQRLLGHSSIKTTMIYVHLVDEITDAQVDLMDHL